jgi:hypothetical protein
MAKNWTIRLEEFAISKDPGCLTSLENDLRDRLQDVDTRIETWNQFVADVFRTFQSDMIQLLAICELILRICSQDLTLSQVWFEQLFKSGRHDCFWSLLSQGRSLKDICWFFDNRLTSSRSVIDNRAYCQYDVISPALDQLSQFGNFSDQVSEEGEVDKYQFSKNFPVTCVRAYGHQISHVIKLPYLITPEISGYKGHSSCEYHPLVIYLALAGLNVNNYFDTNEPMKNTTHGFPDSYGLCVWYRTYRKEPRSLQELSRLCFLSSMSRNVVCGVKQLDLPDTFREYLLIPPWEVLHIRHQIQEFGNNFNI